MEDLSGEQNETYHERESYWHDPEFYMKLFLELFTVVGLVSIIANVLIIFVIIKYKKLRQNVTNIIIAHIGMLQAVYLFITPLTVRLLLKLLYSDLHLSTQWLCFANEFEFVIMLLIGSLMVLLIFDSFLKLYHENRYVKFRRVYKFLIAIFYIGGILLTTLASQACFGLHIMWISLMYVDSLIYILLVIFVIIMNIIHLFKKRKLTENKNNTGLRLANIFFGLWLPLFVSLILLILCGNHPPQIPLFLLILANASPIFNFLYLMYFEDNFNIFFKKVFKFQCNDYSNETLEDVPVVYSEETGVKINEN